MRASRERFETGHENTSSCNGPNEEVFRPDGSKVTALTADVEYVESIADKLRRGETVVI